MRVFAHQLRSEQLIFWRNRESAGFIFVFPLMLFLLLGSLYGNETDDGYPAIESAARGNARLRRREHRLRRAWRSRS